MSKRDIRRSPGLPDEDPDYPPELRTATRAEFVTMARKMKKEKKGCPLAILSLTFWISLFIFLVYKVFTGIVLYGILGVLWILTNGA